MTGACLGTLGLRARLSRGVTRRQLHLGEGLLDVGDDVVGVLDAAGVADEAVGDAEREALFLRLVPEGHRDRQLDQALDAAEARRLVGDRASRR